ACTESSTDCCNYQIDTKRDQGWNRRETINEELPDARDFAERNIDSRMRREMFDRAHLAIRLLRQRAELGQFANWRLWRLSIHQNVVHAHGIGPGHLGERLLGQHLDAVSRFASGDGEEAQFVARLARFQSCKVWRSLIER